MISREELLADAFQDGLARIAAGEPPESVLASYPDLREDIEPALVAALTVRAHWPEPSAAFARRLQAELDREMMALDAPRPEPWWRRLRWPARPVALRLAASAIAVVVALTSLNVASAGSRPGDLLYPVHTVFLRLGDVGRALFLPAQSDPSGGGLARTPAVVPVAASSTPTVVTRRGEPGDALALTGDAAGIPDGRAEIDSPTATAGTRAPRANVPGAATGTPTRTAAAAASATPAPSRTVVRAVVASTEVPVVPTATPPPTAPPPEPTDEPEDPSPTPDEVATRGAIAGQITGEDGRPIAGARVEVVPEGERRGAEVRTDADGRYRIDGLRPGAYHVSAEPPGPRAQRRWFRDARDRRDAEEVIVTAGATTEGIDIRFPRPRDEGLRGGHGGNPPLPPLPTPG